MSETVRITEIFHSLQGEARTVGIPTVFVRLTGCPLRCGYCDTEYAFSGGTVMSFDEVLSAVVEAGARYVTVTGGEPLAQPNCWPLLVRLCDEGFAVSLETSGALSIADVDPRVSVVMDLKTPSSGELAKNDYGNIPLLKKQDQVKFVIGDRQDFDWPVFKLSEFNLSARVSEVLFSPVFESLPAATLAEWVLAERLPARMQIQLHKLLWGDKPV